MGFFDLFGVGDKDTLPEQDIYRAPAHLVDPDCHLITPEMEASNSGVIYDPSKSKTVMRFDESLIWLTVGGYDRHPRPAEVYELMARHFEGTLDSILDVVALDMLSGNNEWLSMAVKTVNNLLFCYQDPMGLIWDAGEKWQDGKYVTNRDSFTCSDLMAFDTKDIPLGEKVSLERLPDDFVRFMYGRSFNELPEEMKDASIYLQGGESIWPLGTGFGHNNDSQHMSAYWFHRASRGVGDSR